MPSNESTIDKLETMLNSEDPRPVTILPNGTIAGLNDGDSPEETPTVPNFVKDIADFHVKFGLKYAEGPRFLPPDLKAFRVARLNEETIEYELAVDDAEMEQQLDALVDTVYIAIGNAYLQGFNFAEAWRRVHAANMAKVRATAEDQSRFGNKADIIKPKGWTAPDLSDLVLPAQGGNVISAVLTEGAIPSGTMVERPK